MASVWRLFWFVRHALTRCTAIHVCCERYRFALYTNTNRHFLLATGLVRACLTPMQEILSGCPMGAGAGVGVHGVHGPVQGVLRRRVGL